MWSDFDIVRASLPEKPPVCQATQRTTGCYFGSSTWQNLSSAFSASASRVDLAAGIEPPGDLLVALAFGPQDTYHIQEGRVGAHLMLP
jgi:hypothetical protein